MIKPKTLERIQKLIAAHITTEQRERCIHKQSVMFMQGTECSEMEEAYKTEALGRTEKLVASILFTILEVK